MSSYTIEYRFTFPDGSNHQFSVALGDNQCADHPSDTPPDWARLEFNQCPHCPLNKETSPHCPVATTIRPMVEFASQLPSIQEVALEVRNPDRSMQLNTTAQDGFSSLLGLLIATSDCPYAIPFRPMARFHLPQPSCEETSFRAVSTYLLSQYFKYKRGGQPDWDLHGLKEIYSNIRTVNSSLSKRLKPAVAEDAPLNAVAILDAFALIVPMAIDDAEEEFKYLFEPTAEAVP